MQYIGLLIAAVLVVIDRVTKWLVVSNMELKESIHIIQFGDTEVLNISYYTNSGAAFSKFEGQTALLVGFTSAVITALIIALLLKKVKKTPMIIAFSLIIGGGIGNLIDRIFNHGLVVDFIDFRLINFAIFNFADICAVCGAILLMIVMIVDEIKEKIAKRKAKKQEAENAENSADEHGEA
jgi:signal peptidase II